jgi:hypothetical protein
MVETEQKLVDQRSAIALAIEPAIAVPGILGPMSPKITSERVVRL